MKNVESYLKEVYEVDSLPIVTFAQSITQLYPLIEKIEGNILLAGHGGYSPERSLFCTPASRYRKPYPGDFINHSLRCRYVYISGNLFQPRHTTSYTRGSSAFRYV